MSIDIEEGDIIITQYVGPERTDKMDRSMYQINIPLHGTQLVLDSKQWQDLKKLIRQFK